MTLVAAPSGLLRTSAGLPAYAWRPVGALAGAVVLVLLALSGRYGYHRDELYFRALADQPAWGYVDQPPFTPLLARWSTDLLGDGLWALRAPAALLLAALVLLLALLAREVGGGRTAQLLAATGALGATPLISGHLLLTASLDWPLWVATGWLVVRALRLGGTRWWLAAGALAGVATYNKLLIGLLLLSLVVALVLVDRRTLRTPGPWLGAVAAAVVGAPNLGYQLANGLPQLQMAGALTGDAARVLFLPGQLLNLGPPAVLVWGAGLVALLVDPHWARLRSVGVAYLVAALLLLAVAGQFYYTTGFLLLLHAVGSVVAEAWLGSPRDRVRVRRLGRLVVVDVLTSALVALPLLPAPVLRWTPVPLLSPAVGDQVGWPTYVRQAAQVYDALTPAEQRTTVLLADNYGQAGALDRYGPELGLPPVHSGHNALHEAGGPAPRTTTAVVLLQEQDRDRRATATGPALSYAFETCERVDTLDNGLGVPNEEQGTTVMLCRGPTDDWDVLWPAFRHVGLSTFCHACRQVLG